MKRSGEKDAIPDGWQRVRLGDVVEVNPKRPRLKVAIQLCRRFLGNLCPNDSSRRSGLGPERDQLDLCRKSSPSRGFEGLHVETSDEKMTFCSPR